jgi:hypothetical protein
MYFLIETPEQVQQFIQKYENTACYFEFINSDSNLHSKLGSTVGVYIRPFKSTRGYTFPVEHPECINLEIEEVLNVLRVFKEVYTWDLKQMYYHSSLEGIDVSSVNLLIMLKMHERINIPLERDLLIKFYRKYDEFNEINKLIPISKLHGCFESRYGEVKPYIEYCKDFKEDESFKYFNGKATKVFHIIEATGICIDVDEFKEVYKLSKPKYNVEGGRVYTNYVLNNITTRPSNTFNNINFAAIPKKGGFRDTYKSTTGTLYEFDFDSYHLRLLANEMNYSFTEEKAHRELAYQMLNKVNITDEEYSNMKQVNFQAIYGNIPTKYESIPFFKSLSEFTDNLWEQFKKGEVHIPISGKKLTHSIEDVTPYKLLNYYIQGLETATNIEILYNVLMFLGGKKSKLVHYIYDAVLIDIDPTENHIINELTQIISKDGTLPVGVKSGKNYNFK